MFCHDIVNALIHQSCFCTPESFASRPGGPEAATTQSLRPADDCNPGSVFGSPISTWAPPRRHFGTRTGQCLIRAVPGSHSPAPETPAASPAVSSVSLAGRHPTACCTATRPHENARIGRNKSGSAQPANQQCPYHSGVHSRLNKFPSASAGRLPELTRPRVFSQYLESASGDRARGAVGHEVDLVQCERSEFSAKRNARRWPRLWRGGDPSRRRSYHPSRHVANDPPDLGRDYAYRTGTPRGTRSRATTRAAIRLFGFARASARTFGLLSTKYTLFPATMSSG
jgi:hypothetical protein